MTTGWDTSTKPAAFTVVRGGGGICGRASAESSVAGGEMTTTLFALGLVIGSGYWLARKNARRSRE